jgi:hypothetical protein
VADLEVDGILGKKLQEQRRKSMEWIYLAEGHHNETSDYIECKEHNVYLIQLVEALCYKPKGRGFDSRWCHWNFSLTYSSRLHYDPEVIV